jgi:hypothetical protein
VSRSDRDQRHRLHSAKACPEAAVGGCNACVTGDYKRPGRRRDRHNAKAETRKAHTEPDQ